MKYMSEKIMKSIANGQLAAQLYKYRSLSNVSKEYTFDILRKFELYFSNQSKLVTSFFEKLRALCCGLCNIIKVK